MRLQWGSLGASGKDKVWFCFLPLTAPVSLRARMSHFVLFHWIIIQIFIGESSPAFCMFSQKTNFFKNENQQRLFCENETVKKIMIVYRTSKIVSIYWVNTPWGLWFFHFLKIYAVSSVLVPLFSSFAELLKNENGFFLTCSLMQLSAGNVLSWESVAS